ncbi:MAG: hypothetical protein HZA27_04315 [Candidatus Omnitrophica bacterium]|nr:hypothetical protein [Candidatus Omnitrophota bacterium]
MQINARIKIKRKVTQTILLVTSYSLLVTLIGCDAFVRKFTRKPKKEQIPQEEMVVAPVEYEVPIMTKEEMYRQHFLYWKSWHDELIQALSPNQNQKKKIDCAEQAITNLERLYLMLDEQRQAKLDIYLNQFKELKDAVSKDIYGQRVSFEHATAEQIKTNILRHFSYQKIKDYLK